MSETFLIAWRRCSEFPYEPLPWLCSTARRVLGHQRPRGEAVTESWYDLKRPAYHCVNYELRDGRRILLMEAARSDEGNVAHARVRGPGKRRMS